MKRLKMFKGTIVENSLRDKSILEELTITKTYNLEDWVLHDVLIKENDIPRLSGYLAEGPWYINVWDETGNMIIIFKDKTFSVSSQDKSTWKEAIEHGKSISIPEEQLDFLVT